VGDAPILLEEAVAIAQEIYLAVRVDGTQQCLELLVAPQGGEDVERAGALTGIPLDPLTPATPAVL
jgi:succinyl-CoA synthetase beta subunit